MVLGWDTGWDVEIVWPSGTYLSLHLKKKKLFQISTVCTILGAGCIMADKCTSTVVAVQCSGPQMSACTHPQGELAKTEPGSNPQGFPGDAGVAFPGATL